MGNTIYNSDSKFPNQELGEKPPDQDYCCIKKTAVIKITPPDNIKDKIYNVDSLDNNTFPKFYREQIFNTLVLPYYAKNIEYEIKTKDGWSKVSIVFLSISTFLIGGSSILSFACGFYPNNYLNFVAGSIGLLSIVFKEFATYANSIDHIKTLTLNELLKNIDINHTFIDSSSNYKLAL